MDNDFNFLDRLLSGLNLDLGQQDSTPPLKDVDQLDEEIPPEMNFLRVLGEQHADLSLKEAQRRMAKINNFVKDKGAVELMELFAEGLLSYISRQREWLRKVDACWVEYSNGLNRVTSWDQFSELGVRFSKEFNSIKSLEQFDIWHELGLW